MTYNANNIAVCQEALYLLRQDVGLPSVADAATDTSLEWQKCKMAFDTAIAEVWAAHGWTGAQASATATDTSNWTGSMRTALVYCVARELAIPLAGRVEDLKNWDQLYRDKLMQARVAALQTELDAVSDTIHKPVLRLILPNFGPADQDLPRSIKSYTDRIDAEKEVARAEVWNAHDWVRAYATATSAGVNWNAGMSDALTYLLASKLAMPTARKDGEPQGYDQLYRDKLMQARVAALQTELDAVSDTIHKPVLRLILPNFTSQDADLPRSIKSYTDRIDAEKEAAQGEVWNAHDWTRAYATATSAATTNWSTGMKDALVYLLASKLAMPTARKDGEPQGYDQLYRDKLAQARVAALQTELDAVSDTLHKPVLRLILPNFTSQDADLPRSIKSYTDRIDAEKEAARAEVWNAHDWVRAYATATSAGVNWNAGMSDALTYLLASKLAMPTARKDGEPQGYDQLYRDKLAQARVAALQTELDAVSDTLHKPVLRLILPNFGPADQDLPRSIKSYTDRIDAEKDAARAEIWNAHEWTCAYATATSAGVNWNAGMSDALTYLLASKLAMPTARKDGEPQGYDQLYRDKLAQARVAALQTELDAVSDTLHKPVLRLILPNFTAQDADLPRSIKSYTDRIDAEKDAARAEVWNAHEWTCAYATATSVGANWTAGMSDALVYLLASKLAMPTARKDGEPQGYDQLYRDKLAQARVAALEAERKTITEALKRDLIALLVPQFDPQDNHLPRSLKAITDRADALADGVRHVVLSAHPWNFARAEDPTPSCHVPHGCDPYAFAGEVPPGCARLLAVYTHSGRLDDWKLFGSCVAAREPVVKAVYVRDDKRPDKWPAAIRRLYLYRLAADTAQTEVPNLVELLEQKYAAALRDAKVEDARESSTPRDAWGRNHYVDAMHGNRQHGPHLPRHSYHGLI